MEKLKLKNLSKVGDVLTSEELKLIYGGVGSGSGSGNSPINCVCIFTVANDPLSTIPYEMSEPITAYTNADCKSLCEKKCTVVGISCCEAACGDSMC